jgi:spermidine synthase
MNRRVAALALVFSGFTALVYEIIWTRLLGFTFGATTEAIGTVLAVFFGGMAIGNWLAARLLGRVTRPLRVYALLELGIGVFALASLPLLRQLDAIYALVGADHGVVAIAMIRILAAALVLLPPTIAMGATLPVVARGVVGSDDTLGRWSAILYAANTLGAVSGAYLSGFWLIPSLGLSRSVILAGGVNLLIAAAVFAVAGRQSVGGRALDPGAACAVEPPAEPRRGRGVFLVFFGISGFVAIGYEVVWSKLFGIVMEGTLHGFAAVLSAYLFGIGAGSLAISPFVDRIRDLPRAFGLLHVAIALAVGVGIALVPLLPYANDRLGGWFGAGEATHLLFLLVVPIVLLPAVLFGAAFPILIRIYTDRAQAVGEGMGMAVAVNTVGAIVASLSIGFWANTALGMDATLFGLILVELLVAILVLFGFQTSRGRQRLSASAAAVVVLGLVSFSFNGVQIDRTIAGRRIQFSDLSEYRSRVQDAIEQQVLVLEGRNSVVTVFEGSSGRSLLTNGLLEAGSMLGPPYLPLTTTLLGILPYLAAESPERALVIGLGGGNTVAALVRTPISRIDVVELEEGVVRGAELLHAGRRNPLEDPRVRLRVNDGRNELLLGRYQGGGSYDLITSQPSHPWLMGAANLFTEEFFALARDNLRGGGVFAMWLNGFRTTPEMLLAVTASFERVFPGAVLADVAPRQDRSAFLLLGMRRPVILDPAEISRRMGDAGIRSLLGFHGIESVEDLLACFEGEAADFAAIAPDAANTDDNAFIETRTVARRGWGKLDFEEVEAKLAPNAPVLPPVSGEVDVAAAARTLLELVGGPGENSPAAKLERLLRNDAENLDPVLVATLRADLATRREETEAEAVEALRGLARAHPDRPEPLRALAAHLEVRKGAFAEAARAFGEAHARSQDPQDAFDAARLLDRLDPEAASEWIRRIPEAERERFPQLALYEAKAVLRSGERGEAVRVALEALGRLRDTEQGRQLVGVNAVMAELAEAAGERLAARGFRDVDHRERAARAMPWIQQAKRALEEERLGEAEAWLSKAEALMPAKTEVLLLRARLALARKDAEGLRAALAELRSWAPTLADAVVAENRFRQESGLPLLPERPPEEIGAAAFSSALDRRP